MSWKFEDWKVSKRENKWSVLNPETNDATRIHPLENVVFCAIKSERCCESWKIFILTAIHSIIIESCVNRLKTDFCRLFLFWQSKHKLNLLECSLQFVTTCLLPPLQLSLHKIFSHYQTTIHITKINFLLYSLSNKKKNFSCSAFLISNANFSIFAEWKITQFIVIAVFTQKLDCWCIMAEWKVASVWQLGSLNCRVSNAFLNFVLNSFTNHAKFLSKSDSTSTKLRPCKASSLAKLNSHCHWKLLEGDVLNPEKAETITKHEKAVSYIEIYVFAHCDHQP